MAAFVRRSGLSALGALHDLSACESWMAEKKKMSVAEILAAARKADNKSGGGEAPSPASKPADEPAAPAQAEAVDESEAAEPQRTATPKPVKPAAGGAKPSVSDILAMARAQGKAKPDAPAAKPKEAKPAAKAAAAPNTSPKSPAAASSKPAAAAKPIRDTASILAAARAGAKAGPVSKAEAAATPKPAAKAPVKAKPVARTPVKPAAFSKPKVEESVVEEDRRGFLGLLVGSFLGLGFTSMAATAGLWALGTARFMFPNVLAEPPSRFKVGPPGNFAPGQVETKFVAQYGVWVVNGEYQGQPQIYALKTVCTHLGCTPNWLEGEQKFKCPCHGSGFYKDGINFEGPAPRPLERYAISLADDGQLQIDKSKTFQEEVGQWSNAESFVPV